MSRVFARPRPGESSDEFTRRFRQGVFGMIAAHLAEHPEDAEVIGAEDLERELGSEGEDSSG